MYAFRAGIAAACGAILGSFAALSVMPDSVVAWALFSGIIGAFAVDPKRFIAGIIAGFAYAWRKATENREPKKAYPAWARRYRYWYEVDKAALMVAAYAMVFGVLAGMEIAPKLLAHEMHRIVSVAVGYMLFAVPLTLLPFALAIDRRNDTDACEDAIRWGEEKTVKRIRELKRTFALWNPIVVPFTLSYQAGRLFITGATEAYNLIVSHLMLAAMVGASMGAVAGFSLGHNPLIGGIIGFLLAAGLASAPRWVLKKSK